MFAILPESGVTEGGAAPVYSVASVGVIWLPKPLKQSGPLLRFCKPQAVVSAATTSGRGETPRPTRIRGISTPKMQVRRASGGGKRSASAAAKSTTRPTAACSTKSQRRIPSPQISIRPAKGWTDRTVNSPPAVSNRTRSSPTRMAGGSSPDRPARIRSKARRDLPEPEGPRIRTARSPTLTAEAWTLALSLISRSCRGHRQWQPDHEARAGDRRLALLVDRAGAILGPDPSAMGLDDLLGDRQAETGVLAKALVRTVG